MAEPTPEEVVIDTLAKWRGPGWVAYSPPRSPGAGPASAAAVLIGNRQIGWTRILTLAGEDRFERGTALAKRYNDAGKQEDIESGC